MKTVIYILIVVAVLVGGFYAFNNYIYNEKQGGEVSDLSSYFMGEILERGVSDIGQPIEGFDAQLLLLAFPGLEVSDFDGVETFEGVYTANGDSLSFERTQGQPISSAARTVSEEGYAILMENISARISLPIMSENDVDALIDTIDTGERVQVGLNDSVSAFGVTVTPTELLEDSRCPIDVTCIQAGTVRIMTTLEEGGETTDQEFILNVPHTASATVVKLVQVSPVAESTKEIADEEYLFTFEIKKK